jgi:hypothetical protein
MKKQRNRKQKWMRLIPAVLAAAMLLGCRAAAPAVTESAPEESSAPTVAIREEESIDLGQGLVIRRFDRYSGIYMEDGSDEIVQDVMMLILENTSDRDLQLARIDVDCGDFTAEFEVTSLPAGEKAVLLELSRRAYTGASWNSCAARNVVFFDEPMDPEEDRIELTGEAGVLRIRNLTAADIPGTVCIYYKNGAADLYYGGITYRVTVPEGIAAGETVTIPAGHYDPALCRVVQVTCGG